MLNHVGRCKLIIDITELRWFCLEITEKGKKSGVLEQWYDVVNVEIVIPAEDRLAITTLSEHLLYYT